MRTVLIILALLLLPQTGYAQSRPAPDTPGEAEVVDIGPPPSGLQMVDALRVLAVTSGVIGGFIAADIISGGVLTAPLLSGIRAAAGAGQTVPQAVALRPVIAPTIGRSTAAELPNFRSTLGQALGSSPGNLR